MWGPQKLAKLVQTTPTNYIEELWFMILATYYYSIHGGYKPKTSLKVRTLVNHSSKDSKSWAADPENWLCDVPGSWLCQV